MAEPIDIRKYGFISMPVKEQWGRTVLAIRLDCHYDGLRFIPFAPRLESSTALA